MPAAVRGSRGPALRVKLYQVGFYPVLAERVRTHVPRARTIARNRAGRGHRPSCVLRAAPASAARLAGRSISSAGLRMVSRAGPEAAIPARSGARRAPAQRQQRGQRALGGQHVALGRIRGLRQRIQHKASMFAVFRSQSACGMGRAVVRKPARDRRASDPATRSPVARRPRGPGPCKPTGPWRCRAQSAPRGPGAFLPEARFSIADARRRLSGHAAPAARQRSGPIALSPARPREQGPGRQSTAAIAPRRRGRARHRAPAPRAPCPRPRQRPRRAAACKGPSADPAASRPCASAVRPRRSARASHLCRADRHGRRPRQVRGADRVARALRECASPCGDRLRRRRKPCWRGVFLFQKARQQGRVGC